MKWQNFIESNRIEKFVEGDWNVLDDLTGRKVRQSKTTREWDGFRSTHSLPRHPQDFIRSHPEQIRTPWSRPQTDDNFINSTAALTISSGAITKTQTTHTVDTESLASTDDLDTVNGGTTNDFLVLSAANSERDVVIKHATGNILTPGGDITLTNTAKKAHLRFDGSNWILIG